MSHERLASVWHSLRDAQDFGAVLRDSVGHFILRSCRSNYDPIETPQRFSEFCLELSLTFDAIRFVGRTSPQTLYSLQDDLASTVLHLVQYIANEFGANKDVKAGTSHIHILGHVLSSAVGTLLACTWSHRPEVRILLVNASQKLLSKAPVGDERLWLIQALANFVSTYYGSHEPLGHQIDGVGAWWKKLVEVNADQRTDIIITAITQATNSYVAAADRVLAALELYHIYWDTEILLLECNQQHRQSGLLAKFIPAPDETVAIQTALSTRFTIQEHLAHLGNHGSARSDVLQTHSQILLRPGLTLSCSQNMCECVFNLHITQCLAEVRISKRSRVIQSHIAETFAKSAIGDLTENFFKTAFEKFALRIPHQTTVLPNQLVPGSHDLHDVRNVSSNTFEASRPGTAHSMNPHNELERPPLMKARSASQPNINGGYLSTVPPMPVPYVTGHIQQHLEVKDDLKMRHIKEVEPQNFVPFAPCPASRPSISDVDLHHLSSHPQESHLTAVTSNVESDQQRPRSPELPERQQPSLSRSTRSGMVPMGRYGSSDSVTTATSSKLNSSSTGSRSAVGHHPLTKSQVASLPEVVRMVDSHITASPVTFDKIYPEVATTPIASVEPDSLSLFSEGESLTTVNPSIKVNSGKKWTTFLKTSKRSNSQFVAPKARFSANSNFIVAWTKSGGGYFDISNPDGPVFHPMNIQDIVLASGGAKRYAVVARCHEGYTLGVYEVGHGAPLIRVDLSRQPAAMDVSRNDRFVAIKYKHFVRVYDLERSTRIDHRLPKSDEGKLGPGGNLVTFAHDSQSFMASTRLGPEKVLTYWSDCLDKSRAVTVQSTAPCGHMDDHGLTGLTVCGPSVRGIATGFLSTFTEKGSPVLMAMSPSNPQSRPLKDLKGSIGTRIHNSAMYVDPRTGKSNLVLINQNNDVFWVTDVFGRDQEIQKVRSLKRSKSMKPELQVSMSSPDEATLFWIEKGSHFATVVKVGKEGGLVKLTDLQLDIEPICSA